MYKAVAQDAITKVSGPVFAFNESKNTFNANRD